MDDKPLPLHSLIETIFDEIDENMKLIDKDNIYLELIDIRISILKHIGFSEYISEKLSMLFYIFDNFHLIKEFYSEMFLESFQNELNYISDKISKIQENKDYDEDEFKRLMLAEWFIESFVNVNYETEENIRKLEKKLFYSFKDNCHRLFYEVENILMQYDFDLEFFDTELELILIVKFNELSNNEEKLITNKIITERMKAFKEMKDIYINDEDLKNSEYWNDPDSKYNEYLYYYERYEVENGRLDLL